MKGSPISTTTTTPPANDATDDAATDLHSLPFQEARRQFEEAYLTALLAATNRNLSDAARRSGIDRTNLRRMLRRFNLR
jgi:two-component system, NtrC family, response regulator HydG